MFNNSKKQAGKDSIKFDNEIIAIVDKLLEYKSFTPSQHKKLFRNFILLHTKKK